MVTERELEEELTKVKDSFTQMKTALTTDKISLPPGVLRADCDYAIGKDTLGKYISGGLESLKGKYAILADGEIVRIS